MSNEDTQYYIKRYIDKIASYLAKLPTNMVCIDSEGNRAYKTNGESCIFVNDNENRYLVFNNKNIHIIELKSIIDLIKLNLQYS